MHRGVRYAGTFLGVLVLGLIVWGLIEPRLLDTNVEEAAIPRLPAAWEGRTVAQISDFQVGMWLDNVGTARRAAGRLAQDPPDLVLITGDFVFHAGRPHDELETVAEILRPLADADVPVYAVLGNHDYSVTKPQDSTVDEVLAEAVATTLDTMGIHVLHNEAVPLPAPEGSEADTTASARPLYLAGIGPHWPGLDHVEETLNDVPDDAPRIVMTHNPQTFSALPPGAAPFTVAGHTHGGQVRIPLLEDWSWLTWPRGGDVHADGWARDAYGEPGNRLYVNRGIGMGGVPIRINCMPVVVYFTLRSAEGQEPAMTSRSGT